MPKLNTLPKISPQSFAPPPPHYISQSPYFGHLEQFHTGSILSTHAQGIWIALMAKYRTAEFQLIKYSFV